MRQVLNVQLWIWTEDESGKYLWTKTTECLFFHCLICFFCSAGFVTIDLRHTNPRLCCSWTSCTVCIWSQFAVFHEDKVVNEVLGVKFWIKLCCFILEISQSFFLSSSSYTLKEVINLVTSLLTHCCINSPMKDGRRTWCHLNMKHREFVLFILFWGAVGSTQEPDPDLRQCIWSGPLIWTF